MCETPRELYANIEDPKTSQTILRHPNRPQHKPIALSDIR